MSAYEWLKMQCLYVAYLVSACGRYRPTRCVCYSTVLSKESVRLRRRTCKHSCFLVTFGKANEFRRVCVSSGQHGRSWVGCVYLLVHKNSYLTCSLTSFSSSICISSSDFSFTKNQFTIDLVSNF